MKKPFLSVILTATFTLGANAQNVTIPDPVFKSYLIGNPAINTNLDTEIQVSEAAAFNGTINCSYMSISDLTGIEAFTSLTTLYCEWNQLSSLDISKNTALTELSCHDNQLTSLDVSGASVLTRLKCNSNQLTNLDVSKNTALKILYCEWNQLTSLDVSTNTALTLLYCSSNQLTNLDVSKNTALTQLICEENQLTSLDVSGASALTRLECNSNPLTSLDVSGATALTTLECNSNQLTSLDVSKNIALKYLYCNSNQLTSLDVSKNTALKILYSISNQLSSLDVSKNTALTSLHCSLNQLSRLDVKNGNNSNMFSWGFKATNNSNLSCIQVDDASYSTTYWADIDATASFSEDCSSLSVNEISLENHFYIYPNPVRDIINFSIPTNVQMFSVTGQILAEMENVTTLDLSNQPTGIYFLTHTNKNGQVLQRNKIVKE
jgi:Leucine-rich repeat (LRR) protein